MRTLTTWSVADYQHMRELGILDRRRCELINGEIWDMAPEGEFQALLNYGMNLPPSPQFWGSRISQSPPELGDLGGKIANNSDRFIFRFSNAEFHWFLNDQGADYLRRVLQDKAKIFEAHPITLAASEPQPDIAIVRLPNIRYLKHHPYPEDIYWLIEVADTTLAYDLGTKRTLYAEAGIPEYWVINIADRTLTVFSDLQNNDFAKQDTVSSGIIHPVAFPEVAIDIQNLVSIPK